MIADVQDDKSDPMAGMGGGVSLNIRDLSRFSFSFLKTSGNNSYGFGVYNIV